MTEAARDHLDRRAFLASLVGSAFALGVAGKVGLPEAMASPERLSAMGVDYSSGPPMTLLVKFIKNLDGTVKATDWLEIDAQVLAVDGVDAIEDSAWRARP